VTPTPFPKPIIIKLNSLSQSQSIFENIFEKYKNQPRHYKFKPIKNRPGGKTPHLPYNDIPTPFPKNQALSNLNPYHSHKTFSKISLKIQTQKLQLNQ
jgi:hypothetical protein